MTTHDAATPDRDPSVDAAIAAVLARAGEELRQIPDDVAGDHLSAITALAAVHVHTAPVATAAAPWRTRLRRLAGLTAFKLALGAGVAVAATTGGLAATGNLPDPVQRAVSEGAGWFGVQLPVPDPMPAIPSQAPDERTPDGDVRSVVPDPIPSPTPPVDLPHVPDRPTPIPSDGGAPSGVPPSSPGSERPTPASERPSPASERPMPPSELPTPESERPEPQPARPTEGPQGPAPVAADRTERDTGEADSEDTPPAEDTPSSPPNEPPSRNHPGDGGPLPSAWPSVTSAG